MLRVAARSFAAAAKSGAEPSAKFSLTPFALHGLKPGEGPNETVTATRSELLDYFSDMVHIRRMEVACDGLYKSKFIRGFLHLYDGQESLCVGMEAAMTKEDFMITAYRCHGNQYMREKYEKGVTPLANVRSIMAELMGRRTGVSEGKGGSMHLYSIANGFFGGNGIVGAQGPVGAGLALALKHQGKKNIAVTCYGDGAANQGQIFEAMNMAFLWKLPVVFVCENNKYGMGTSIERSSANTQYYHRGDVVPGLQVDGMDVLAVREAMRWAKDHANKGLGPTILELKSYRFRGHSMSDPGVSYRSAEEVAQMRASRDPIENLRKKILDNEFATAEELKAIEKQARVTVDEAIALAKEDPEPELKELKTDIYVGAGTPHPRGVDIKTDQL